PLVARWILPIGTSRVVDGVTVSHPEIFGLEGWQLLYIIWALPAIVLGVIVLIYLTDKPLQAKWLKPEEREALEAELESERAEMRKGKRMTILEAFSHPKVLMLTLAYFCVVTCSYGMEYFMPSIIKEWHHMDIKPLMLFIILPPTVALIAQLVCGWSSDHFKERRFHAVVPLVIGATAMFCLPLFKGTEVWLTVGLMMVAFAGFKGYMPAFWSLPSLFLVEAAAASSIGLINSVGNLGGFMGSYVMGKAREATGSYDAGLWYLSGSMLCSAIVLFFLGLGKKERREP
ncbi:MAG TPA: MFS transporter, partial [Candidatus Saccharimonadia bacterium]|nr:MFS transporter [Candidatus Saccharimonadia bacterium]